MLTRSRSGRRADEAGQAIVEFALLLPVLMVISMGIVDFGLMFARYNAVNNAAREGARVAATGSYSDADVQARVVAYLNDAGLTNTLAVNQVERTTIALAAGGSSITIVRVTVGYPYEYVFFGPMIRLIGGSLDSTVLIAEATMRLETPAA